MQTVSFIVCIYRLQFFQHLHSTDDIMHMYLFYLHEKSHRSLLCRIYMKIQI